ncbi:MAG: RlmE family RNA methyltransferase [Candidatus Thermoplasmatota archaeon]|nr:RlmE family RNA methyltransferase [Candidatus Thermoplasmatota archaeon]MDI6855622.1 RlmE family RNA methyltransferase [Candidatus Thermoplasmatota archaeon]
MRARWLRERKRDYYYKKAKREGYRSRAAYKLLQINEKYKVIKEGNVVIDLGAAPGGWSQVAKEFVGSNGFVLGIDLKEIVPVEGVEFIKGDITQKEVIDSVLAFRRRADVVIADLSPSMSGTYSVDHMRSVHLCDCALSFAEKILEPKGNFVTKIFQGELLKDYINKLKSKFEFVKIYVPEAKRKRSSEVYLVAKGFKG